MEGFWKVSGVLFTSVSRFSLFTCCVCLFWQVGVAEWCDRFYVTTLSNLYQGVVMYDNVSIDVFAHTKDKETWVR